MKATQDRSLARIQSQFGAAADRYATSEIHAHGDSLRVLLELARPRPEWRVLDVATGAGHTAFAFAPEVAVVTAVDLTDAMVLKTAELAAVKGLNNVRAVAADAAWLPFASHIFDVVTCRLAFHHFPDPTQAIRQCRRVLKQDGVLVLTDNVAVEDPGAAEYYNAYEKLRDPSHHRVYSLPRLREMLTSAGFTIEATRELTKELEFSAWTDRQNVSKVDKDELLAMMRKLPDPLQQLFSPRWADGTLYFSLHEAVILASHGR